MLKEKECARCGVVKSSDCYYKNKTLKSGLNSWCIACETEAHKKRQAYKRSEANPDRDSYEKSLRTTRRKYYKTNRESILSKGRVRSNTVKGKLSSYKSAAKSRNYSWELSDEEFESMWQRPCFYCAGEIEYVGIDRVDSSKGYRIDNVVPCCRVCNQMKMDFGMIEFIVHMKKILAHLEIFTDEEGLDKLREVLENNGLKGIKDE